MCIRFIDRGARSLEGIAIESWLLCHLIWNQFYFLLLWCRSRFEEFQSQSLGFREYLKGFAALLCSTTTSFHGALSALHAARQLLLTMFYTGERQEQKDEMTFLGSPRECTADLRKTQDSSVLLRKSGNNSPPTQPVLLTTATGSSQCVLTGPVEITALPNGWVFLFSSWVGEARVSLRTVDAFSVLFLCPLGNGDDEWLVQDGFYSSSPLPALLPFPSLPTLWEEARQWVLPHQRRDSERSFRVLRRKWRRFNTVDIYLSPSKGCVCVCVYIHAGWPLSLLFFFKFFFPNATDETCSLFRIRKNIWLHESHSPCEYWTIQLTDPALSRGWHWVYWLGWDAQGAETWESCLIFHWVGINLAIYCFSTFLLLSHRTIIIFFQWRMTSITLKINCSIVWKYLSWISLALVRAEHPQPRKGGRAVPALNSALQMSVTCF